MKVHGALKVVGSQIQDQYGKPVQLKGMSLFWSQWSGGFWNPGSRVVSGARLECRHHPRGDGRRRKQGRIPR